MSWNRPLGARNPQRPRSTPRSCAGTSCCGSSSGRRGSDVRVWRFALNSCVRRDGSPGRVACMALDLLHVDERAVACDLHVFVGGDNSDIDIAVGQDDDLAATDLDPDHDLVSATGRRAARSRNLFELSVDVRTLPGSGKPFVNVYGKAERSVGGGEQSNDQLRALGLPFWAEPRRHHPSAEKLAAGVRARFMDHAAFARGAVAAPLASRALNLRQIVELAAHRTGAARPAGHDGG